jgi:hypothetical protein
MSQPWIRSPRYDGWLILAPPFLALLVVLVLPAPYRSSTQFPLLAWVAVVLLIDVAHVYGTLFQTYFDPVRRRQRRTLLLVVPLACYAGGVVLHAAGGLVFWRALAYLAVFHFIRQQYGFLRLYARHDAPAPGQWLPAVLAYAATLYPLLYWHLSAPRNFNWFVDGSTIGRWAGTSPPPSMRYYYLPTPPAKPGSTAAPAPLTCRATYCCSAPP